MLTTLTQSLSLADVCNTNGCSKHEVSTNYAMILSSDWKLLRVKPKKIGSELRTGQSVPEPSTGPCRGASVVIAAAAVASQNVPVGDASSTTTRVERSRTTCADVDSRALHRGPLATQRRTSGIVQYHERPN